MGRTRRQEADIAMDTITDAVGRDGVGQSPRGAEAIEQRIVQRYVEHPGRGGCGVGAIVDLSGRPSHELVDQALQGLTCMEHRGGSIDDTGDGAGILMCVDPGFFAPFIAPGRMLPQGQRLSVAVLFLPVGQASNLPHWQREIDATLRRHGLIPLGWRRVPVDEHVLGTLARQSRREVWHVLVGEGMVPEEDLPITFFRVKAALEQRVRDLYVASFSPRTMVYKALATGEQLRRFYLDLRDEQLRTHAVVFHRRYSTNTFSNWYLAQTFRTLGHNGEINTIKANRNAVENLTVELALAPILMQQGSDSADMDRVIELFTSHGVSLPEAIARLMPMAWRDIPGLPREAQLFFRGVQRALGTLGAWEGPAAIVATDGEHLVAALDRMGLRPLRWLRTRTGRLHIGSELGAIPVPFHDIAETGQLDPGEALGVQLHEQKLLRPRELLAQVVARTPINFRSLAEERLIELAPAFDSAGPSTPGQRPDPAALNLFGWTHPRLRSVEYIAEHGKEAITSMGFDRPLAVLSAQRPPLTKYFRQIVAVVTNPPVDPLREDGAFDLTVHLGGTPTAYEHAPAYQPLPQYRVPSPVLTPAQFAEVRSSTGPDRPTSVVIDCTFEDPRTGSAAGAKAISNRIGELCRLAVAAVKRGESSILILSDRAALQNPARLPLPMVLVTSALHNALVLEGRRRHASIVVETGEIQEGHDAAVFIANGATALFPYLYFEVGCVKGSLQKLVAGLDEMLMRVMSKMGICSLDGYRGSRLFEAVGLAPSLVEHYLPGIPSRLGGLELEDLYEDLSARKGLGATTPRESDPSVYRKEIWQELQTVARGHDPAAYGRYLDLLAKTPPVYLRDLLRISKEVEPIEVDEVDSEERLIAVCFRGAAMSLGALHRVAHQAIAQAFNHFGALSNCGEGGEDERRDKNGPLAEARSRVRQVASGRFGVEARYLVNADEISIKIGQGAKPGEGGMLPASKVTAEIARIRKTQQGVALISPPPHHDIYSIEDLAQLIYNLRQVNPTARISVKVPGISEIGTIAVGIAKAGADLIEVSGAEGGTGAASSSSIEHAGLPMERALSETHQALSVNGVRGRVRIRADGGIKTGFDVAVALALGADEVSLGTVLMIAEQCIFCHGCAQGMCPAGIATQSDLVARRLMTEKKGRAKDDVLPDAELERGRDACEAVKRYLLALAKDFRDRLAQLGVRHPEELVGRVELLERWPLHEATQYGAKRDWTAERAAKVDLSELLAKPVAEPLGTSQPGLKLPVDATSPFNARIVRDAFERPAMSYVVTNTDRAVGATLAGKIALGQVRTPPGGFLLELSGYAGQGLGFACVDGMRIELNGIANDTVGEVMSGGAIVIRAPRTFSPEERGTLSLIGNAACYGATGGRLFVEGRAGQRVGVRNSGAIIIVEGAGKYAFEYMTGGIGVVLGPVGPVIGSGMTGGRVYVLAEQPEASVAQKVHKDARCAPLDDADTAFLLSLLEEHIRETGSHRAKLLLADYVNVRQRFVCIHPKG